MKDRGAEGAHLGNLGNAYYSLGEYRRAIEYHEQALAIDREIGDRRGEGQDLGNLGIAYYSLGKYRRAIQYHEQSLVIVIARQWTHRRGECAAFGNLGSAHYSLGEYRRAFEYYEQQLNLARAIDTKLYEGNALWGMSLVLDRLGERAQAIQNAEAALKIFEQIESPSAAKVRTQLQQWKK